MVPPLPLIHPYLFQPRMLIYKEKQCLQLGMDKLQPWKPIIHLCAYAMMKPTIICKRE